MVRLSNNLVGILNIVTLLLSIPIIGGGIWLSKQANTECERFLDKPVIALGVFILLVSIAGIVGSCCKVSWLLWVYLLVMFLLILLLFCFTIFGFVVTNKGAGKAVSERGYKEYRLGDYSNWLQKRVNNHWTKIVVWWIARFARGCLNLGQPLLKFFTKNTSLPFRWYTMVHADGSVLQTWDYLRQHGLQGFINIWPNPTATAWKIIACYGAFEAALQLLLPGRSVEGPISPAGNRPVYKANGVLAYAVTLVTYIGLWWFGIFNPTIVYDHLGGIFSALIFGSFLFCIFLYIKGHLAPSSTDSGSSGNMIIDFYWGMELYPRIGKNFDSKVFTNCRFGMMSWAVLAVTYCIKQIIYNH